MLVKIVSPWFFPVPMICEILAAGLVLLWFTRRQKAGKVLMTAGTIALLLMGNSRVSAVLLGTLEQRYHPFTLASLPAVPGKSMNETFIVVLGGSYSADPRIDLESRLSEETIVRLVEGIRICRRLTGCKLILSGGPSPQARTMSKIASSLGVRQRKIILEESSRNTEQEAQFIKPTVGAAPFLLVTSASHMPRAMALFRKLGMKPIASPTDYLAKQVAGGMPEDLYPGCYGLHEAERAVYEYLGMAWEKVNYEI